MAQFLWIESSAGNKWITNHAQSTGADWLVVPSLTFSFTATDVRNVTGVDATELLTGLMSWTVIGLNTLSTSTIGQWISFISDGTGADGTFTTSMALSIIATWVRNTGINKHRLTLDRFWRGNFCAAAFRLSFISPWAFTDCTVVTSFTVGVDTTCTGLAYPHTLG